MFGLSIESRIPIRKYHLEICKIVANPCKK